MLTARQQAVVRLASYRVAKERVDQFDAFIADTAGRELSDRELHAVVMKVSL